MNYRAVSFKERLDLHDIQEEICGKAFPTFLYYSEIAATTWEKMIDYFREYQLLLLYNDKIVSVYNCMPMNLDIPDEDLPEEAFNWGLEKGISSITISEIKKMCAKMGIKKLIIPIRPTLKSKYPLNDIDQHCLFINKHGRPLTRKGIYLMCQKYLSIAVKPKRLNLIHPVHSFRHGK
jgi:hypothetical protein